MAEPNLLERIYQFIFGDRTKNYDGKSKPGGVATISSWGRKYDIESIEIPFRDPQLAKQLQEMVYSCAEIATALEVTSDYAFTSAEGDEHGFAITEDDLLGTDEEVMTVARAVQKRVMCGTRLQTAVWRALAWGDAFANLAIDIKAREITGLIYLPTWQMFRVEDDSGNLRHFEQYKKLNDPKPIVLHPIKVVHWRWKRVYKYGRSHFAECLTGGDWERLAAATQDMMTACRNLGANPNVHLMPQGTDELYKKAYREDYEAKLKKGMVTDIYLAPGGDIKKAGVNWNPFLNNLLSAVNLWRARIGMRSRVPGWLMQIDTGKARDIAGQPALAYAVFIGSVRMMLTEGIRQIIDTELALKGIPKDRWRYKITFPRVYTDPFHEMPDDTDEPGITDTDSSFDVETERDRLIELEAAGLIP